MFRVDAEVRDRVQATLGHTLVVEQLVEGSGGRSRNRAQNFTELGSQRRATMNAPFRLEQQARFE